MTVISAPVRYAGSNATLMPKLLALVPRHTRYVSVFGGSGSDILNKPASRWETWNDLDGHLFNLFSVLKDPKRRKELIGLVCLTAYCREEFRNARTVLHDPASDPVRRAWATVVTGNQVRAGVHFATASDTQWANFRLPSHTLQWPPAARPGAGRRPVPQRRRRKPGVGAGVRQVRRAEHPLLLRPALRPLDAGRA